MRSSNRRPPRHRYACKRRKPEPSGLQGPSIHEVQTAVRPHRAFKTAGVQSCLFGSVNHGVVRGSLKSPRNQHEKISKKVGVSASGDTQSWYINKVDGRSVLFYVKDRNQPNKFSSFVSPEVASDIYAIGKRVLRVEIKLSTKYLADAGLSKPSAWRGAKGKAVYQQQFDWLRTLLKVDADYRVNKPQQRHIDLLSERDQLVLVWYLKGKPVNHYPQIKSGEWKKSPIKWASSQQKKSASSLLLGRCPVV